MKNLVSLFSPNNQNNFNEISTFIVENTLSTTKALKEIANSVKTEFVFLVTKDTQIEFGAYSIDRFVNIAKNTNAGIVYSNYFDLKENELVKHPVIDYQVGSLRDDFDFGPLVLFNTKALKNAVNNINEDFNAAAFYYLRLLVSQNFDLVRVPEFLYTAIEYDTRKSGEKQFDYVDPKNRDSQIEMEKACTLHLKSIGAYLEPKFNSIEINNDEFKNEASVIIPVRDRTKTIGDAIESVLNQKTDVNFNLIVVDNHSTDGTTDVIKTWAEKDKRVVHIIPERKDLQIGGCWNEGLMHESCGKYVIQLDSDDIYADENTIQTIVDKFNEEKCAMVVGSYKLTNFQLEEIPPGLIDHKEWTPDNGRNNALRINGLGAPRAFYTPVLREIKIPNVSYGEDYAVGLEISRNYQIGRIYHAIYLCRRWEGNSDAALAIEKVNENNLYKDKIRSLEVMARQKLNGNR